MQKKINIIIWGVVVFLFLFFGLLKIVNSNRIYSYQILLEDNAEVKVYLKGDKKVKELEKKLKQIKKTDEKEEIEAVLQVLKKENITMYTVHIDDFIAVGNHYANDKYQVAVTVKDGTLFKILSLENQVVKSKNVFNRDEFDRIIVIGNTVTEVNDGINDLINASVKDGKKYAKTHKLSVYWLKGKTLIESVIDES